jgi:glycerophosphoryl diester phosphodiesterase
MQSVNLPKLIAHRGANRFAPENTLPAFQLAHQHGATWVEFDVQLTQDNVPIILHDDTLNRTTNGWGLVRDHSFAAIRALTVKQYGIKTQIPTLTETLDYLVNIGMNANIEIKAEDSIDVARDRKNAELTCNLLRRYLNRNTQFLISSFSMDALYRARQVLPEIPIGMLLYIRNWKKEWPLKKTAIMRDFQNLNAYSLHINHDVLTPECIAELKTICPHILTYTVNNKKRAQTLFSFDISSIFTDNVLLFE